MHNVTATPNVRSTSESLNLFYDAVRKMETAAAFADKSKISNGASVWESIYGQVVRPLRESEVRKSDDGAVKALLEGDEKVLKWLEYDGKVPTSHLTQATIRNQVCTIGKALWRIRKIGGSKAVQRFRNDNGTPRTVILKAVASEKACPDEALERLIAWPGLSDAKVPAVKAFIAGKSLETLKRERATKAEAELDTAARAAGYVKAGEESEGVTTALDPRAATIALIAHAVGSKNPDWDTPRLAAYVMDILNGDEDGPKVNSPEGLTTITLH